MAHQPLFLALGITTLTLFIITQLVCDLGIPDLNYWHWRQEEGDGERLYKFHNSQEQILREKDTNGDLFLLGVGKADITGPVVELNLMGYANISQVGTGLRQRIYSRAFIIGSVSAPAERFVYLVLDTQSGDTAIRDGILRELANVGADYSMYGQQNIAVTGTHSHSGPGAWLNYLLPQITSLGFDKQSYQAIVDGALLSIKRAHESLAQGRLSIGTTTIPDSNINRSPYSYLQNPASERARYSDDVDKTMTLLRFTRASDGKDIGILNWFAVHGTSLLGNQTLIAGDNKGVAAYLMEKYMTSNGSNAAPGFVAGFSQANVGDTTPNINGAWCEDGSNQQCKFNDSTCNGRSQDCHGRGPYWGLNDGGAKSCYEIGRRQYVGALDLYNAMVSGSTGRPVVGQTVRSLHTFSNMSGFSFKHPNGSIVSTCPAALGYSFAAGTTDGPGAFDFTQNDPGEPNANPLWAVVSAFIHVPDAKQKACQYPKPILLDVGETHQPYDWAPNIVDIQVLRVGQLLIIVSPGEATTMSGRRWREALYKHAISTNLTDSEDPIVVLGGPSNTYSHYITTEEEYSVQRYEGASTLFGPHTLNAYINLTLTYARYLSTSTSPSSHPPAGTYPQINTNNSLSFITGVVYDSPGFGKSFGDVVTNVKSSYTRGSIISVTFTGANPRNNLRLGDTYATVEKKDSSGGWVRFKDDFDWELVYQWKRISGILATSEVTVLWETGPTTPIGAYRIRYFGDAKSLMGRITSFIGTSGTFTIT